MEAIINWLENKDYQEGVSLYNLHGSSDFLKKIFEAGEGDYTRQKLEEELTALLPIGFKNSNKKESPRSGWRNLENGLKLDTVFIDEARDFDFKRAYLSEPVQEQPSSQDNIQYLKLIRRRNDLNRQITRNMALLDASTSKARRFETAKQIKSLDRAKREVWAEIDYFDAHGSFMPVAIKPKVKTDELQRLYVQIYKAEKRLEKTDLRNRAISEKLLAEKRKRVEEIRKERAGE